MKLTNVFKTLTASLLALTLAACGTATSEGAPAQQEPAEATAETASEPEKLTVIATANPHEIILEAAKKQLLEQYNVELEIIPTEDYYTPNRAVSDGDADANYYQHVPFFDNEKAEIGYKISNVGGIHIEPFGFYSEKYDALEDLPDNANIVISNSVADHGRILTILEIAGLLKLKDGVDSLSATIEDIEENPHNFTFTEVNPEQLTNTLPDAKADLVAINGNYAIEGGLSVKDALAVEANDGLAAKTYGNIIATSPAKKDDPAIKTLVEVLQSKEISDFINGKYDGAVVPLQ